MTANARPLRDLVKRAHQDGLAYREMENRAGAAGHSVSKGWFNTLVNGRHTSPLKEREVLAVAAALERSADEVWQAMKEEFYPSFSVRDIPSWERDRRTTAVGSLPEDLSDEEVGELERLTQAWLAIKRRQQ